MITERKQLASLLSEKYDAGNWNDIYSYIFSHAKIFSHAQELPNETKSLAEKFQQVGYVECANKERLLLFAIQVKDSVNMRRNRATLNSIIAKWINPGADSAAIGIFYKANGSSYRFTFVRKTAIFDSNYCLKNSQTNAKRYTYILGEGKHCNTAIERFEKLHNIAKLSLDDVEDAFSVEALTKQFYQELFDWYQWALSDEVGITFPNDTKIETDDRIIEEHLIRLITRLMFVWFIKQKDLVPNSLFVVEDLKKLLKDFDPESMREGNYYNGILQNLFFATLNNEISKRGFATDKRFKGTAEDYGIKTLFRNPSNDTWFKISNEEVLQLFSTVPFLNGGLFECLDKDTPDSQGKIIYNDGFSRVAGRQKRAFIPNAVFFGEKGIIPLLSRYNFTIEENSPDDMQVALDPELLGKVFENLLGAFNQETQETARNNSGSFYTPREIVNYMVDEALIASLGGDPDVRKLFEEEEMPSVFKENRAKSLALAEKIKNIKILDPACGSGAFPMGILNRMMSVLQKLDPASKDSYSLKLHLIEKCIYGIDIQTIAVQISKLRCFISLICEQEKDAEQENFGIPALPNLETTFIAANSLLTLPPREAQGSLFEDPEIERVRKELLQVRHQHFGAKNSSQKKEYRKKDKNLRERLAKLLADNEYCDRNDAQLLASWNPYDQNTSSAFFDSEWMFGFSSDFDIVIGNPPYIQLQNNGGELGNLYKDCGFSTFAKTGDIYSLFYEQGYNFLKNNGHLCYITSNKWMRAGYGEATRKFFAEKTNPIQLIDFAGQKIFESATVDTNILLFSKSKNEKKTLACTAKEGCRDNLSLFVKQNSVECAFANSESWTILSPIEQRIKQKIEAIGTPLKDWDISINYGIKTGCNEAFIIDEAKKNELIAADPKSAEIIRPILRGRDIKRYSYEYANLYLIATFPSRHYDIEQYPAVKKHLLSFDRERLAEAGRFDLLDEVSLAQYCKGRLEQTGADIIVNGKKVIVGNVKKSRKKTGNKWFETQDQISYWDDFSKPKLVWTPVNSEYRFTILPPEIYFNNSLFMITGRDIFFFCGVLNSKTYQFYLSLKFGGDTYMYGSREAMIQVPIPKQNILIETISTFVDQIISASNVKTPKAIDTLVYRTLDLTSEEIRFIENHCN